MSNNQENNIRIACNAGDVLMTSGGLVLRYFLPPYWIPKTQKAETSEESISP